MELQAEWTPDCQGKQDYDARPSIPPSARATIYLQDEPLTAASFEGATEAEVKAKVEAWAREQFAKVVSAMGAAFRA